MLTTTRMIAAAGTPELAETTVTARCQLQQGQLQMQEHLQPHGFQMTAGVASKIEDNNTVATEMMQGTTGMLRRAKMLAKQGMSAKAGTSSAQSNWQQQGQKQQQPVLRSWIQTRWICN
jgi:hypothetical protein